MSILDFFKKDKTGKEKKADSLEPDKVQRSGVVGKKTKRTKKAKSAEKKPAVSVELEKTKQTEPREESVLEKRKRDSGQRAKIAYRILETPHISEKASYLVEKNQYIFNVSRKANKQEIKQAIKEIYGVDVVWANVINIPRRRRRIGRTMGWKQGYRKAVVKIKEGQKIELLPR